DSVEIPVSRQLLCNVSEAFARMLNGYFVESSQSRITLEEVTAECLITFSDFILKAVSCNHVCDVAADTMALDDILGLWSFSDKYIMDYPKQWCERWMLEHIRGNHVRFNEMRILGDILKIYRFFTENFLSGDPINEEKDDGMDTYRIIVKECIKRLILQFGKVVMTNEYEEWIRESKIIDGYYEVEIDIDMDRHENNNDEHDLCNDGPLVFFDQVEQLLLHIFRTVVTTNDLLSIK
ncbi:1070_t:CDS:1, partial [Paraglomus occultum]